MTASQQPEREGTKQTTVVGNILRGSLGNMVEWFDFYSFTVFGTYFAHVFFASGSDGPEVESRSADGESSSASPTVLPSTTSRA